MEIKENSEEILNAIVEEHGIEHIKKFLNAYSKTQRKQQTRVNYYDEIAKKVYYLVMNQHYSKTRAIDRVADENDLTPYTVRNHCAKFDKEAKEFDYYSFGKYVDDNFAINDLAGLAKFNNIDYKLAEIYYYKYENTKKKIANNEIDTSKFKSYYTDDIPF